MLNAKPSCVYGHDPGQNRNHACMIYAYPEYIRPFLDHYALKFPFKTNQPSQIALFASSFSLSALPASSLAASLLFRSFSLTARSYALLSSVCFGGFTPSAPAIKRPAAADDFSGLFSEPIRERGVLLEKLDVWALAKVDQSVLFLREWEEVGDMGVGGGGPGVASVGVEGGEGVLEEGDGEAASSQLSATALEALGLAEDGMVRFLREDSSPLMVVSEPGQKGDGSCLPGSLRDVVVIAVSRATNRRYCGVRTKSCVLGNECKEAATHRKQAGGITQ